MISSHFGYLREAETELFAIFKKQQPDGMVPNQQRINGFRSRDPELLTFRDPNEGADYTQPPIWATAISDTYQAIAQQDPERAAIFLESIYPYLKRSFDYFAQYRQLSSVNPLVFNVIPQETGRDSDPSLDGYMLMLPTRGHETAYPVAVMNRGLDYLGKLALGGLNRLNGWDPQQIRRYYRPVDPLFNGIYASNLRVVSQLAKTLDKNSEAENYETKADEVEERMINDLYVPEARQGKGAFLVHNIKGFEEEISISSAIGPLMLKRLPEKLLADTLDLLDDDFNTPYPWPTVSTKSRRYDPEAKQPHVVWAGAVKLIANYFGARALRHHKVRSEQVLGRHDLAARCHVWVEHRVIPRSKLLLKRGYYESYSPVTGKPKRTRTVMDFVWNGLIETL